jgi:hypothetical protein
VQDHLKAVFAEVGVGNRQLVATVFAGPLRPHLGRPVGPHGYFTTTTR